MPACNTCLKVTDDRCPMCKHYTCEDCTRKLVRTEHTEPIFKGTLTEAYICGGCYERAKQFSHRSEARKSRKKNQVKITTTSPVPPSPKPIRIVGRDILSSDPPEYVYDIHEITSLRLAGLITREEAIRRIVEKPKISGEGVPNTGSGPIQLAPSPDNLTTTPIPVD